MVYKITKKQFDSVAKKLLNVLIGNIKVRQLYYNRKSKNISVYELHNDFNENFADIHTEYNPSITYGCKKELRLMVGFSTEFEAYVPIFRKKQFGKSLIDYVFEKTGIECDCVEYDINYKEKVIGQTSMGSATTIKYNKKKNKIKKDKW